MVDVTGAFQQHVGVEAYKDHELFEGVADIPACGHHERMIEGEVENGCQEEYAEHIGEQEGAKVIGDAGKQFSLVFAVFDFAV